MKRLNELKVLLVDSDYENMFNGHVSDVLRMILGDVSMDKLEFENLDEHGFSVAILAGFVFNLQETLRLYELGNTKLLPLSKYDIMDVRDAKVSFDVGKYRYYEENYIKGEISRFSVVYLTSKQDIRDVKYEVEQIDSLIVENTLEKGEDIDLVYQKKPYFEEFEAETKQYLDDMGVFAFELNAYNPFRSTLVPPVYFCSNSLDKKKVMGTVGRERDIGIYHIGRDVMELQSNSFDVVRAKLISLATWYGFLPIVMVEDTSFEMMGLNCFPGYAGKMLCDTMTPGQIYSLVDNKDRKCRVTYVVGVLIRGNSTVITFSKEDFGDIVFPAGDNQYGWDTIFRPVGSHKTVGEMSEDEKRVFCGRYKLYTEVLIFIEQLYGIRRITIDVGPNDIGISRLTNSIFHENQLNIKLRDLDLIKMDDSIRKKVIVRFPLYKWIWFDWVNDNVRFIKLGLNIRQRLRFNFIYKYGMVAILNQEIKKH